MTDTFTPATFSDQPGHPAQLGHPAQPGHPAQRAHAHQAHLPHTSAHAQHSYAQPGQAQQGRLHVRRYRLVDGGGAPHPVLDDLYDSLEAAWSEASRWWQRNSGCGEDPVEIGIEVSTPSGDWRTLRFPGG